MAPTEPAIGAPLAASELGDAEALVSAAGWNQVAADWEIFLKLGTVFTARADSRVVATAAILPYGAFAWVSMVLVLPDHRRHGLGTKLLKRCMAELDRQGRVPVLDATPAGKPLYRQLGFVVTWGYHRLTRPQALAAPDTAPAPGVAVRPIADTDWAALCAYDAKAFGADRSALLGRLRGRLPAAELIAEQNGRIAGFMLGRNGRTSSQIGPLVAASDGTTRALLSRALAAISGPVYIDFADSKTALLGWLASCGFTPQRPLTRMLRGRDSGAARSAEPGIHTPQLSSIGTGAMDSGFARSRSRPGMTGQTRPDKQKGPASSPALSQCAHSAIRNPFNTASADGSAASSRSCRGTRWCKPS